MKIYVYCPRKSDGALALVKALKAERLRRFDGINFWDKTKRIRPEAGSVIINWGALLPELDDMKVLNHIDSWDDKLQELRLLRAKGIAVPDHNDGNGYVWQRLVDAGFLPRHADHTGGIDLLNVTRNPDYWVRKMEFTNEYRIHSFDGKSIRAGIKVVREGFALTTEGAWRPNANLAHPWIKSWDGGWRISYKNFRSTVPMRNLAHKAVGALKLTFGAVDMAETVDGKLFVLEVNRAPGVEGTTIEAYADTINKWIKQQEAAA